MRFEVLLRDAEIDAYRQRLAGDADEAALQAQLEETQRQIADDFAFVAACNVGGEFMADEKIDRLERIAALTWTRHLDDRLGISQDEATLKNRSRHPRCRWSNTCWPTNPSTSFPGPTRIPSTATPTDSI